MRRNLYIVGRHLCCSVALMLLAFVSLTACEDDHLAREQISQNLDSEEYVTPSEDVLAVVSDLPSYVVAYDYEGFGAALVNRLQNRVVEINDQTQETLASVVLHSSQIAALEEQQWGVVLVQLMMGRNIIIIEPTIHDFSSFCDQITDIYVTLNATEEGRALLDELDVIPGARQTLEAFYEMSEDPSKIESMFMLDTDNEGVFAEAIAVRGSDFHVVDRMMDVAEAEMSHEQIAGEDGTTEPIEEPQVEESEESEEGIIPYAYGLFADVFTTWINEQEYYAEEVEAMRSRAAESLNTRAAETNKLSLEDISTVQKVQYTINAATPYNVGPRLPVTVSFEICSIYMGEDNSDYYCIYKKIKSYNQVLDCGPEKSRDWRVSEAFRRHRSQELGVFSGWNAYLYYGPFMRNLEGSSICHDDTDAFVNSSDIVVDMPDANSIARVADAVVVQYSPKNSIGSIDKSDGFSYSFDGGVFLSKEPGVNLGFSVSYDSSTSQTIDNLDIIASTTGGIPEWKYVGQNLPEAYFNLVKMNSHSEAPSIMRRECEVDQSWIWRVPNPEDSYRLYDKTAVTTAIMYHDTGFLKAHTKYANQTTTKRVSFLMMPPPRSEQRWMMSVSPYSEELNTMLATTHSRFWKSDNHELKLSDRSEESRITIEQFVNDFQSDLESKRLSWKNRNFMGRFTFAYYNIDDAEGEPIEFDFVVE